MGVKARRTREQKRPIWGWLALALLMLAAGVAIGYALRKPEPAQPVPAVGSERTVRRASPRPAPVVPPQEASTVPASPALPRLALVIDDLGHADPALVTRLCAQEVPLTVAVLPFQEHTTRSAKIAHEAGKEVMLHLPMEPLGYPGPGKDPGPGAILYGLPEGEARARVRQALMAVPHRKGVNNHMGSRITPDATRMRWVLEEVKARKCYFVDSRTEKNSVAYDVAEALGIPSVQRKVFLDDDRAPGAMEQQWRRALDLAQREGEVLVIGHIHPETVGILERLIPGSREDVRFVKASDLARVHGKGQEAPASGRSR